MCRKISLSWLLAPVAALFLAGCPSGPVLQISPTAVSLNGSATSALVTLANAGSGSLSWNIVECPSWVSPSIATGTLAGGNQSLHLTSLTTGLPAGAYTGDVVIESNGGTRTIAVVLSVVAPPTLEITPADLDFGGSETTRTLLVRNAGAGTLAWNVSGSLPVGYTLSKTAGSLSSGASETVIVTVNRALLGGGTNNALIAFESNGGSQDVALTAVVQPLQVTPLNMDFGPQLDDLTLTIANSGTEALTWTINNSALPPWLMVSADSGTVDAGASDVIVCTADRTDVAPGLTSSQFTVASDGGSETVYVTVEGPDPVLFVTPLTLDFGSTDDEQTLTIQNTGTGTLAWTIEEGMLAGATWFAEDNPWLSVAAASGNTESGQADAIAVNIDRALSPPDPDTPHNAWLRIQSADGDEAFVAVSQITLPPTLRVLPETLDFGTVYIKRQLAIWNGGLGTVNWRIDTAGIPAWLSITPTDAGIASGDVAGAETDALTLSVNRTGMVPADSDYAWTFEVTAEDGSGGALASKTVHVSMNVGREATIAVDTGADENGKPYRDINDIYYLPFGTLQESLTFTIANTGTAALVWTIDNADFPQWLTSVSPRQATLQPGQMTAVTVTIDRTGVVTGDDYEIQIQSNDPVNGLFPVRVEFQVPKRIIIGVKPKDIAMGSTAVSATFEVANLGDSGSVLNFEVSRNKDWVYFYPDTGSSEGTDDVIKNWVDVNISIDRGQLDGTGGSAELLVRAYETDATGKRVYPPEIASQTVKVSVEAAPLSFESAWARLRVPSLVRFVLLMRDLAYEPIQLPYDVLGEIVQGFNVYEKDILIEPDETNKFLTPGDDLRTNLVILLDYSGSMYAAAQRVLEPEIAEAADPLQAAYNQCVGQLIEELPANYKIALMEFHDRGQCSRLVVAPDGGPAFTSDKDLLIARLESIDVDDHGATELLPAVVDATGELLLEESHAARIPFDDADVRGIVCVSDGRLTTPPGKIKEIIDLLWPLRVRFFGLGWGDNILHEPMARLAAGTGGHYYPTATQPNGEVDEQDEPVLVPALETLLDWCQTQAPETDPCDQSIPKDLRSQVAFSYVTLTEDTGVKVRVDAAFDNPNDDDGVCLPDQRTITGSFSQTNFDFVSITGDNNLGQISMRSDGIKNGAARVVIRAEYVPRNITAMQFSVTCGLAVPIITRVPQQNGGIVYNWDMSGENYALALVSPDPQQPLPYGAYGDLLYADFEGLPPELTTLTVNFEVLEPVWTGEQFDKYFTYPDTITIGLDSVLAPAFPTPKLDIPDIDFGTGISSADVVLTNIGGSHEDTGVWLQWAAPASASVVELFPESGRLISTTEEDAIHISISRTGPPGVYWDFLAFECNCNTLNVSYLLQVPIAFEILDPVLELSQNTLDFGAADHYLEFEVRNSGQSTLEWSIDPTDFPEWLTVAPTRGSTINGQPNTVGVWVERGDIPSGPHAHTFTVYSTYGQQTITVNMTVL